MSTDTSFSLILTDIRKEYTYAGGTVSILEGVSLTVNSDETVSIVGPSGSGKSTLLNIIGSLDKPTSGTVVFGGKDISALSGDELAEYRNKQIGFVFQDHHLLPQCTAFENILLPTLPSGLQRSMKERAESLLEKVGLKDRIGFFPAQLSGGERQRVAVARALINKPNMLLCDEPTGNLDEESSRNIISLLTGIAEEQNIILVIVTHNLELADSVPRRFELKNGTLKEK